MRASLLAVFASLLGCAADAPPREPPAERLDKAALFGDPELIPTREGERARTELAYAAEIAAAIEVLPSVLSAEVDVELEASPPRTLVVALTRANDSTDLAAEHADLERQVRRIASAVLGDDALDSLTVVLEASPPQPRAPTSLPFSSLLSAALLGLGASLGVTLDRLRSRASQGRSRKRK